MSFSSIFLVLLTISKNTGINQVPFHIYQIKRPTDPSKEIILQNFLGYPGIDVLSVNRERAHVAIPNTLLPTFNRLGINVNGTDILERRLLSDDNYEFFPNNRVIQMEVEDYYDFFESQEKDGLSHARINAPFHEYLSYNLIVEYLMYLEESYPKRIRLVGMEKTANNRTVYAVIIRSGIIRNTAIFIDGGVIARQWISISAALYIIKEIGTNIEEYPELKNLDWIIMPVVNPDGYEYSRQNKNARKWIKNRNCPTECRNGSCGVNLDINFPFFFAGEGISYRRCSNMYIGIKPLSEPESRSVLTMLQTNRESLKLYIGLRSDGPSILYPWGSTKETPSDESELQNLAQIAAKAMQAMQKHRSLPKYWIGNYAKSKFPASGILLDYMKSALNIKYCYNIDIRKRIENPITYMPKKHEILPLIEECFQGVKEMAKYIYYKYPPPKSKLRQVRNKRRRRSDSACITAPQTLVALMFVVDKLM